MALSVRLQVINWQRFRPLLSVKHISTSNKNQETVTEIQKVNTVVNNKNWVSYGFDRTSKKNDSLYAHLILFGSITIAVVGASFILMYAPDPNLKHWAQREAFIELRRREQAGLPLIDRNLVDPKKFKLPSEEELEDFEIII